MSPAGMELSLTEQQIFWMVGDTGRGISPVPLIIFASDSYGPHMHRTWVFKSECGQIFGSIERYWGGLKLIASVLGGSPRTSFFREDGTRTTNRGLKEKNA